MPERPEALMIFAAGRGTRMGALTRTRPKPLIRVAGRALIDHALAQAEGASVTRRVVNCHYLADRIAAHLAARANDPPGTPPVAISHEPVLLDTGGGLRAALPLLGAGPVFTLNSDAVWAGPNPLAALRAGWHDRAEALLLLVPPERAHARRAGGDFTLGPDGRLKRGGDLVYTGAQIIRTGALAEPEGPVFSLNAVWDAMARRGTLRGLVHDGAWCDVGHPGGIRAAEALLREWR